jgi:uncharacterized protein (TIGR02271 family)
VSQTSPYTGRQIEEWYDYEIKLHDADGDDIGNVVEVNPDFIVCEATTGFLGLGEPRVYFIPRDQVQREDEDDWYLEIDKDEIESMNWQGAPRDSAWSSEWTEDRQLTENDRRATRLRRYEEDLDIQKVQQQTGEVVVSKHVVEETKTVEVPVRREEVHVERRPVSDATAVGDDAFEASGESIRVPVMEEQVEVRKVARPVEEIEITKTPTETTQRVEENVRREEFDIDDDTKS